METILLIFQVILAVGIIGLVLVQKTGTDGFGLGSGSGLGLISGRAKANFFTRATAILATLFMLNSMALALLSSHTSTSVIDRIPAATEMPLQPSAPSAEEKTAPVVPEGQAAPVSEAPKETPAESSAPAAPAEAPQSAPTPSVPRAQ